MQPCPESREFRDSQCSAFDSIPYEGTLFHWAPHYDDSEPCALTCRGRPRGPPDPSLNSIGQSASEKELTNSLPLDAGARDLSEEDGSDAGAEEEDDDGGKINREDPQMDDEALVVVARLAERVHDGTRCRPGSLDMCIDGKCRVSYLIFLHVYIEKRTKKK